MARAYDFASPRHDLPLADGVGTTRMNLSFAVPDAPHTFLMYWPVSGNALVSGRQKTTGQSCLSRYCFGSRIQ